MNLNLSLRLCTFNREYGCLLPTDQLASHAVYIANDFNIFRVSEHAFFCYFCVIPTSQAVVPKVVITFELCACISGR